MNESSRVTSELLWRGTGVAVLIDIPLMWPPPRSWSTRHCGVRSAGHFWDSVYKALFPTGSRWLLPPGFGLLLGAVAVAFWRVSCRATRWPAVWFVLLGGVVSLLGHGVGIRRGLLRVPLLSEASPASALVVGVFEFIFYWCGIVALAVAARKLGPALRHTHP